ncbi:alpha/beta hydrolase [Sphingomonas oryzagri]|uniref:Alpha/beta hydrolase n=1 Tax=Sphingomonas oryzagri TaxID=3042314 RepID=A0ABT6MXQ1_9SPHN|nr:alpha/beta hydrolase [Sphingomonas oryzagri]MDH7637692.1 alpha/beta hydrolase [Sphingomonas oryzagri]
MMGLRALTVRTILLSSLAAVTSAGAAPVQLDGQTLDPGIQAMLAREAAEAPNAPKEDVVTAKGRAAIRQGQVVDWTRQTALPPKVQSVENAVVQHDGVSVPVRIYHPIASGPLPIIVYYHGGGWFIGGIEASDRSSRQLANDAKAIVVSVEYRLSPEAHYPAAWDDAESAYAWTVAQAKRLGGSPDQVCVGGDSAGGNMAIDVTTRRQDKGEAAPLCQILYYPAVDMRAVDTLRATYASSRLFGTGFHLDKPFTDYVLQIVFPGDDLSQPEISPLLGKSRKMPPTLIATAGFDPLRDSERAYAAKLAENGNVVSYVEFPSLIHGFLQHTAVTPEAAQAARQTAEAAGALARNAIAARAVHATLATTASK